MYHLHAEGSLAHRHTARSTYAHCEAGRAPRRAWHVGGRGRREPKGLGEGLMRGVARQDLRFTPKSGAMQSIRGSPYDRWCAGAT